MLIQMLDGQRKHLNYIKYSTKMCGSQMLMQCINYIVNSYAHLMKGFPLKV